MMDTYGHLTPGQEADAVAKMEAFAARIDEALQATGMADVKPELQHERQQSGRETMPESASRCNEPGAAEPDAGPTE